MGAGNIFATNAWQHLNKKFMSFQLLTQDVLFYQRFLKSNGFYDDDLDGKWGPKTNKADADFQAQSAAIAWRKTSPSTPSHAAG